MNIHLTKTQTEELIESARADVVKHILTECREQLCLLSVQQASGMLDCTPQTLLNMKLPRIVLIPNKVVRYKLSDVLDFIAASREK